MVVGSFLSVPKVDYKGIISLNIIAQSEYDCSLCRENINRKRTYMASQHYQLLDSGNFQKLEQIGPVRLIRQSLQSFWAPRLSKKEWDQADAIFTRGKGGDGKWNYKK